jgi:hypothetical protein
MFKGHVVAFLYVKYSSGQNQVLDCEVFFLKDICDFVMVCSNFMLLLFFMSSGRNQCLDFFVVCCDSGHVLELS